MASTMFVTASALFVLCVRVVRDLTLLYPCVEANLKLGSSLILINCEGR